MENNSTENNCGCVVSACSELTDRTPTIRIIKKLEFDSTFGGMKEVCSFFFLPTGVDGRYNCLIAV